MLQQLPGFFNKTPYVIEVYLIQSLNACIHNWCAEILTQVTVYVVGESWIQSNPGLISFQYVTLRLVYDIYMYTSTVVWSISKQLINPVEKINLKKIGPAVILMLDGFSCFLPLFFYCS